MGVGNERLFGDLFYHRSMPHIYAQVNPMILAMLVETLNDNSIGMGIYSDDAPN